MRVLHRRFRPPVSPFLLQPFSQFFCAFSQNPLALSFRLVVSFYERKCYVCKFFGRDADAPPSPFVSSLQCFCCEDDPSGGSSRKRILTSHHDASCIAFAPTPLRWRRMCSVLAPSDYASADVEDAQYRAAHLTMTTSYVCFTGGAFRGGGQCVPNHRPRGHAGDGLRPGLRFRAGSLSHGGHLCFA